MSEYWYSLPLGDGLTEAYMADQIRSTFEPLYLAAGRPQEMAVFKYFDSEGRLQCEVTAYFSPAAGQVAEAFGAHPCTKPPRTGLGLLAGDESSWTVLFPETRIE